MKRYRLYCFDLDDTLISTYRHAVQTLYPMLAEHVGLPPPSTEVIYREWRRPLDDQLAALFPGANPAEARARLVRLHQAHPVPPYPEARRTLEVLRRHARRLVVFSAGDPAIVDVSLEASLGGAETFDAVYSFERHGARKEAPGALDAMRGYLGEHLGSAPGADETIVVGDDPRDALLAANGGADFAGLTQGPSTAEDFASVGVPGSSLFPSLGAALKPPDDHGVVAIIRDATGRFLLVREGRTDSPFVGLWSGPHGRCAQDDVLEEETVAREVREECGVDVAVTAPLFTSAADARVRTLTFWGAALQPDQVPYLREPREASALGWFEHADIMSGDVPLYPATRRFFDRVRDFHPPAPLP